VTLEGVSAAEETRQAVEPAELQRDVEVTQAAGILSLGNVTSRVLGLVRETVKADLFGAGGHVSALDAAINIPMMIYNLLVGGMINSALVPVLSDYAVPERREELWRLLSILFGAVSVVGCGLMLLGELLAPQLVWLSAAGLSPEDQALATGLLRLMLPGVLFLSLASVLSGVLYALKRFTLPAFTPAISNAAMVAMALLLGRSLGVRSMAIGLLAGSAAQVVLQLPGLRDAEFRPTFDLRHPAVRRIGRLYLPILIGMAVDKLAELLSYHLASRTGPASISWMRYSVTMIQLPLGLVVTAISLAILPTLSRQAAEAGDGPFKATLARGLRLVLALTVPATVGLWVLARPIIGLVFEHGDFTPTDTVATVAAMRYQLLGLIFAAIDQPLIFAFYARKDTWTPALVGGVTVVLYAAFALVPTLFVPLTLNGLILANSLKWAAHALLMLWLLRRRIGGLPEHGIALLVGRVALASLAMGVAVSLVAGWTRGLVPEGLLGEVLLVGGAGAVGVGVYVGLSILLGIDEIHLLYRTIKRRFRRLTLPRP